MGALLSDTVGIARIALIGANRVPARAGLHGSAHYGTELARAAGL
jgi:hypothetical protein